MATPQELARFESGPQNPRERVWWDRYSHERLNAWRQVQDPLAEMLLEGKVPDGSTVHLDEGDGELQMSVS